jgi:glutathione S-transferase
MTSLQYVDLETARAAKGTRIVTTAQVPSPWSEATKGLFEIAALPALVLSTTREHRSEVQKWTGIDNVPVVVHDDEPVRTCWSAIGGLAARLAAPNTIVPDDPVARAADIGVLEMIAGEQGLGWNARLAMIQASLESDGARGFPLPVAKYLAPRYGVTERIATSALRDRVERQLGALRDRLAGRSYFGGSAPSAIDVYSATFLTPLFPIDDSVCPQMSGRLRAAFAVAHELYRDLVPEALITHRAMMFERHLAMPIRL